MFTSNTVTVATPNETAYARLFQLASDIEHWPAILPHYRYMNILSRSERQTVADFGAERDGFPCKWRAVQEVFPDTGRITYRHIGGITKGMWVEWRMERDANRTQVTIDHALDYATPIVGPFFARWIVGELFVHNIAGKTLDCIRAKVEAEHP